MFPISLFKDKGVIVLSFFILLIIGIYVFRFGFLGSNTDWMSQHTVFPDYFRTLFYEMGDLFPNYAANLGAGQNLYNFSYYGFLNPIILISYLLPFVKMPVYIMAASLISLAAAVLIFYKWLKTKGFSDLISISVSIILLLAAPMLYHSYKQIIFINFMPFLCLALIGVDRYCKTEKSGLLIFSIFLMIMSSFYFSVSGLLSLCLYWISIYPKGAGTFHVKDFIRSGARFLIPVITAVMMAGILLIPTFASLLESQRDGQTSVLLYTLFLPQFKLLRYSYSPYGIGLSSIAITVLLSGCLYNKRSERILAFGVVLITVFPIFLFILNGGLYAQDKVLIPFLPIICYLIALFFQKLEREDKRFQKRLFFAFLSTILLTLLGISQTIYWFAVFADSLLMLMIYFIYLRHHSVKIFILPVIAVLIIADLALQGHGELVGKDTYHEIFNPDIKKAVQEVNRTDISYYRMDSFLNKNNNLNRSYTGAQNLTSFYSSFFQKEYFDFRNDVFQLERPYRNYMMQAASQNPLFLTFMGVKYVISDYPPVGYELFRENGNVKVYRNENVFPLGYVSNNLITDNELYRYSFPFRQELLLHYASVGIASDNGKRSAGATDFKSEIRPVKVSFPETESRDFSLKSKIDACRVAAGAETESYIALPRPAEEDEVLFLKMNVKNLTPLRDISVKIRNEQNRLSSADHVYYNRNTVFHFAVSVRQGEIALPVTFSAGEYEFSSIRGYTMRASDLIKAGRKSNSFKASVRGTRGDVITGLVNASDNGYFITTIPYDSNFRITVDGKPVSFNKVNTAFIGFPLEKGSHKIIFYYISPGFYQGVSASIIGFLFFVLFTYIARKEGR